MVKVLVKKLESGMDLPIPKYQTSHSAGMDLYAAVNSNLTIKPGERALVKTGIAIALPDGFEAQLRPRSGMALKHGVTLVNSPATIDADYRGEVCVILVNLGNEEFVVERGMRVAQMVITEYTKVDMVEIGEFPQEQLERIGGFGSTGTN